jgi:CheY-like chemotaxis protein
MGWLQIVRRRPLETDIAKAGEVIDRNSQTLRRMIEDLLDLSAVGSGKLGLKVQDVDLEAALQLAVDSIRPRAAAQQLTLELHTSGPVAVAGDPQRLGQIVTNLLTNAVKFTPPGGRVVVSCARDAEHATIVVADTGIGIPAEMQPFIFDPFRQGGSAAPGRSGLGLGLAITRRLVELHGGTIVLASSGVDQGAAFTVRLPALADRSTAAPGDAPDGEAARLAGATVFVIDDDPDARAILDTALRAVGASVTTFESAGAALARVAELDPDLLLVDLQMPGMDGYAFILAIRQAGRHTPAIAVTAQAADADRRRAFEAGFDRHLAKPVDLAELARTAADLVTPRVASAAATSPGSPGPPSGSPA